MDMIMLFTLQFFVSNEIQNVYALHYTIVCLRN